MSALRSALLGGSVALSLALSLASGAARADESKPASPSKTEGVAQARGHFSRGVKLYGEDDFRAALIEFGRAYELAPNWAVLYNVGQSQYQLRDYAAALQTLEKYIAEGGARIPADRRSQVDREVEELRGRTAHVTLESNTPGADLFLDETSVGVTPLAAPVLVGAGRHTFRASKTGLPAANKVVDIAGGDDLHISLDLFAAAAPPVPVVVAAPAPPPPRPAPNYTPAITSLAVGGAGIVVGTVFGILAVGNKSSLKNECQGSICPSSAQSDLNALSRNGDISTTGFVVGGVGVAASVVLYLVERGGKEPSTTTADRAGVHPWFGATAGGFGGSF